jgi:hypothetical protein
MPAFFMQFQQGNQAAAYSTEEINKLIDLYIKHREEGFSKESFVECSYQTVEKYVKDPVFEAKKAELEKAERAGILYWEKVGRDLATGKIQGNPTSWIFNVKNKLGWKDKSEVEHEFKKQPTINLIMDGRKTNDSGE